MSEATAAVLDEEPAVDVLPAAPAGWYPTPYTTRLPTLDYWTGSAWSSKPRRADRSGCRVRDTLGQVGSGFSIGGLIAGFLVVLLSFTVDLSATGTVLAVGLSFVFPSFLTGSLLGTIGFVVGRVRRFATPQSLVAWITGGTVLLLTLVAFAAIGAHALFASAMY